MDKNVANMDECKVLVLDEADKLLSQDFQGMLDHVISRLPKERQILLYSATFPLTVKNFMVSDCLPQFEVQYVHSNSNLDSDTSDFVIYLPGEAFT